MKKRTLKEHRTLTLLSPQELSDVFGVSVRTIQRVEKAEEGSGKFGSSFLETVVGNPKPVGTQRLLKPTTLWGYFTPKEIGENVLNHAPIPDTHHECLPISGVSEKSSL